MKFNEIIKNEKVFKALQDFVSFKTLKGYPCPFCRCKEVKFEKADESSSGFPTQYMLTDIRVSCKTCRRVENYVRMKFSIPGELLKISNFRSVIQVGEDVFLDMEEEKYKLYDRHHKFNYEVPPFSVNYLELDKLSEKIEIMSTFS